jgi:putative transposase
MGSHPKSEQVALQHCHQALALRIIGQHLPKSLHRLVLDPPVRSKSSKGLGLKRSSRCARKFDGSSSRNRLPHPGSNPSQEIEPLVVQLACQNKRWGYRRLVGALSNLGHEVSHQTVANILKRHGLGPASAREKTTTWREFIRSHLEVLAAVDFFTVEVWTMAGLMTYYVLTFMRVASRQVCIVGITASPDARWMEQMARNVSHAEVGFLNGCR